MKKGKWIGLAAITIALGAGVFFGDRKWSAAKKSSREDALALMPSEASAVLFAEFDGLRESPFFTRLLTWAPGPPADADYAQFVKETGFDYEHDLDRVVIAMLKRGSGSALFAILDGKFDRRKISAYALKTGSSTKADGREIFSVALSGSSKKNSFTFLRNDRMALTNDADLAIFLRATRQTEDAEEWRKRFGRLAGSPVFAVIRQPSGAGLAAEVPGGLRSPQLSVLLDQLEWITLAGKPEDDRLRAVVEGECRAEVTARQLVDLLNGVVILAQAGLNDARTRRQLDPAAREAYLELLRSADISKFDRGDTHAVRLVFEITPGFLEAVRRAPPPIADPAPGKALPGKSPPSRKGHT